MNPYLKIPKRDRLRTNPDSGFHGVYSPTFETLQPRVEVDGIRLVIPHSKGTEAQKLFSTFPDHIHWVMRVVDAENEFFLELAGGDRVYMPIYNIYFALVELAPYVEDAHILMYSIQSDENWIEEYRIQKGQLLFQKHDLEFENMWGIPIFFLTQSLERDSSGFRELSSMTLWDSLFDEEMDVSLGIDQTDQERFNGCRSIMNDAEFERLDGLCKTVLGHPLNVDVKEVLKHEIEHTEEDENPDKKTFEIGDEQMDGYGPSFEEALGAPCDEAAIDAVESAWGRALPPSYTAFLQIHNGWKCFPSLAGAPILSAEEQLSPQVKRKLTDKHDLFEEFEDINPIKDGAFPLAIGDDRNMLLFEPSSSGQGEMTIVRYYLTEEEDRYRDLVDLFEKSIEWLGED